MVGRYEKTCRTFNDEEKQMNVDTYHVCVLWRIATLGPD